MRFIAWSGSNHSSRTPEYPFCSRHIIPSGAFPEIFLSSQGRQLLSDGHIDELIQPQAFTLRNALRFLQ
jgi:hypothetical protein